MAGRASLETLATRLLSATETLHATLLEETSAEGVAAAWDDRLAAFDALREAVEAGERVGPAVRACVARVRELDGRLLEHGARRDSRPGSARSDGRSSASAR